MKTISDVLANHELFADAGVAAFCADAQGRLLWVNDMFSRLYCKAPADAVRGRSLSEFIQEPALQERLEILRSSILARERTLVYDIWGGTALQTVLTPLAPHDDAPDGCVLGITRREPALVDDPVFAGEGQRRASRVIRTRTWDLGVLAPLSRRELEILALLSEGLSNAQVAELVHRTVKTVEFHRASISAKTGIASRVRLARAAQQAGLYDRLRGVGYRVPDIADLDKDPDLQAV